MRKHDREAALNVIEVAEKGDVDIIITEQVMVEFRDHNDAVQVEATKAIERLIKQFEQANALPA